MRWSVGLWPVAGGLLAVSAKQPCPVYGPLFPTPKLLDHPRMKATARDLDEAFRRRMGPEGFNYSYVVQAYSTDDGVLWQTKYTSPILLTVNTTGVKEVDENTGHRVGSITKLFTILTFLSKIGDRIWNDPITKYIPELSTAGKRSPVYHVDWESVTVGSLATFNSGIMRDFSLLGELTEELPGWQEILPHYGYPPLSPEEIPSCGKQRVCSRKEFLAGIVNTPPFHAPYQTSTYNNIAFVLLSYVAEAISGKPFLQMIDEAVIAPLNLTRTFTHPTKEEYGVIPGTLEDTMWSTDLGNEAPTGNVVSSAADLTKLGRAIMKSTLLEPALTRRWLKGHIAFLPDSTEAVGMPWTLRQRKIRDFQWVTTFAKGGRVGTYTSLVVIAPDLNLGWTIMGSGRRWDLPDGLTRELAGIVGSRMIEMWLEAAREQAGEVFGGRYASSIPGLNSTLTVRSDDGRPGIGVYNWISNGTDMAPATVAFGWPATPEDLKPLQPSIRLYPTGLQEALPDGGRRVSFRGVFEDLSDDPVLNSFVQPCDTWVRTLAIYGSRPIDLFVFTLDKNGKAVSVENLALRSKLDRVA